VLLVPALIVVEMFQHPGGIGAEKLLGPLIGLAATDRPAELSFLSVSEFDPALYFRAVS
jgi:hypothetical protein